MSTSHQLADGSAASGEDGKLHRKLGFWSLTAAGIGSVIGSAWLFAPQAAAQFAGPSAIISWVIAGVMMLAVALVSAELGMVHPESGGIVRYPQYSNGRLTGGVIGWCLWVAYIAVPATEAAGVMQYLGSLVPGLYADARLTGPGIGCAVVLMAVFVLLNWFGVKLFAISNNVVTAIKIFIPTIAVVALLATGFSRHGGGGAANFTAHGFAPNGPTACLSLIAVAGIVFAYSGFSNIVNLSGEAKNPRRTIPLSLTVTMAFTILLYIGLQVAFIVAAPESKVLGRLGWAGIDFESPFASLAMTAGMFWLFCILMADAAISPSGAGLVFTTANARNVFGLAKNGFIPRWFAKVHEKSGIPRRALVLNFVLGLAFLLPLPSWQKIVAVTGVLGSFTICIASISVIVFRLRGLAAEKDRLPGIAWIAPVAFVISTLVLFWVQWAQLIVVAPIIAIGVVIYLISHFAKKRAAAELLGGVWFIAWMAFIYAASFVGSYGGKGRLPEPWGSIIVAVVSVGFYAWGIASGVRYMAGSHEVERRIRAGQAAREATAAGNAELAGA